ncbi:MAG: hypothetical protein Q9196_000056 [Gyalolechia fulgens]
MISWITPSIFQNLDGTVVDEWTFCEKVQNASDILRRHWDSWVALKEFQKIKDAGFNTVRIPIGYWAYTKSNNDPYIQGAAPYIDKAIGWARQTGLKVWIDLHGAPLSQNGFDNSGRLIRMPETPGWINGWNIGARYDGYYPHSTKIGSCDNINFIETWSQQMKTDTQLYIAAQISVFEQNFSACSTTRSFHSRWIALAPRAAYAPSEDG